MSTKPYAGLKITPASIGPDSSGTKWVVGDVDHLARIVVIVAMGQARHACQIIARCQPATPAVKHKDLVRDARRKLRITGNSNAERRASRWRRDALLFEIISWAAAQQEATGSTVLQDPHLSSTAQGLDGLMLKLNPAGDGIAMATVFEDKCSANPRRSFRSEIMPLFKEIHHGGRTSELVAVAATLLHHAGFDNTTSPKAAARVLDKQHRAYRASLALKKKNDKRKRRTAIFRGFNQLRGIGQSQRIGATLVTSNHLRRWFDDLAARALYWLNRV